MNTPSNDININQGIIKEKNVINSLNKETNSSNGEFSCQHGCHQLFKSKRQKLLHHDKLDYICHEEKSNLINLIEHFNFAINKLIPTSKEKCNYKEYLNLVKQYKRTKNLSKDPIQFEILIQLK